MTVLTDQIDEAAACRGDAPYLEDAGGAATLSYAGLKRSARAWARHLDEAGIPPGARVAVRRPDPFGYAGALVGILAAGRVAVPLDPGAPAADVARVLKVRSRGRWSATARSPGSPGSGSPGSGSPGARSPARRPGSTRRRRRPGAAGSSCARAGRPGRPRASCSVRIS
jgi:AMP-binding enzyme